MVTMKDIQRIREELKKLKPSDLAENSDKPLSNREAVKQLGPALLKMRKRGFSVNTLVELLQKHQIDLKGNDLSRYLRAFQGEKATTAKAVRVKNKSAEIVDLPINSLSGQL